MKLATILNITMVGSILVFTIMAAYSIYANYKQVRSYELLKEIRDILKNGRCRQS